MLLFHAESVMIRTPPLKNVIDDSYHGKREDS